MSRSYSSDRYVFQRFPLVSGNGIKPNTITSEVFYQREISQCVRSRYAYLQALVWGMTATGHSSGEPVLMIFLGFF